MYVSYELTRHTTRHTVTLGVQAGSLTMRSGTGSFNFRPVKLSLVYAFQLDPETGDYGWMCVDARLSGPRVLKGGELSHMDADKRWFGFHAGLDPEDVPEWIWAAVAAYRPKGDPATGLPASVAYGPSQSV